MARNWKSWIFGKGERILQAPNYPAMAKELAWKAVKFASDCGKSNPLSFALRPIASHEKFRAAVGLNLAIFALVAAVLMPVSSMAEYVSGSQSVAVAGTGDISLETKAAVQVPLKNYVISQGYWFLHPGMDLAAETGEPIKAVMTGKVVMAEYNWFGYGNCVIVQHNADFESLYGHMSKIMVKAGDEVKMDTVLGLVGSTGHSTGPHLHLEIHEDGKAINPGPILGI